MGAGPVTDPIRGPVLEVVKVNVGTAPVAGEQQSLLAVLELGQRGRGVSRTWHRAMVTGPTDSSALTDYHSSKAQLHLSGWSNSYSSDCDVPSALSSCTSLIAARVAFC